MRSRLGLILCVFSLLVALAGCGGSDGGGATPPPTSNPPPPPPPPPPVIGADGGMVTEVSGGSVIVPAGAITTDTTIRIARDSTGAPPIPADLTAAGSMYAITPHGGEFAEGVEVRLPVPNVTLTPYQEFKIAKAQPGEPWVVLQDTVLDQGSLSAKVDSFSFFMVVVVTYPLEIAQAERMRMTTSLTCTDNRCSGLFGPTTATFTVTSNGGQAPGNCLDLRYGIGTGATNISWPSFGASAGVAPIAATGGSVTRTLDPGAALTFKFGVGQKCGANGSYYTFGYNLQKTIYWASSRGPTISIVQMPEQVDVVEGLVANVDAVLAGGAAEPDSTSASNTIYSVPSRTNRAIIDWERSDDNGASWRVVAQSYQDEANSLPGGVGFAWRYWGIRHGFVATATDQGALLRLHACYTPPTAAAPPCVTSTTSRINVLQQSALPTIVDAPHSMLVRTGQTANLSATASGLPAPTLQWQTRPANSNEDWSNVATGNGATTAAYTTAPLLLADNGTQYRVVATNALGSVESAAATVSVSDVDVAPTIATQPGSLSVTAGSDAVFAIVATGTEALSYQWRFNGTAIAGANSAVLRLEAVNNASAGSYSVTVSNDAGDADSNAAILKVSAGTPVAVAPAIVTQPTAVTVNAGNTATFAVGVDGSGPFSFQWRRNGAAIPGATTAVLTLNSVGTSDAASYSVLVSNSANPAGVASDAAALTVNANGAASAPSITTQPANLIVAPGGSGILAVAATGSGPLSYQWLADGVPIGGETEAVLTVTNASESSEGRYAVAVSNSLGTVVSQEVQVILLGAPFIAQEPAAATAVEHTTATFSVSANGSGLRYQWLLNGLTIAGANEDSYTTSMLTAANSGAVYSVIVYNGAGVALSQSAVLTVLAFTPPTVTQHPVNTSIEAGSAATLCATFGGTPPFIAQMTRWSGTAWLPVLAARLLYDNSQACTTTPVLQLSDNGAMFRFETSSGPGQAYEATTNAAIVTVTAPPIRITATTLASRATNGATANNSSAMPSLSADGNLVAFTTTGTNLVPGFTNPPTEKGHAYVRNIATGVTTAINQTPAGTQSSRGVVNLKLAAGGRYAVFSSLAGDLVADDTNGSQDVFVRDLQTGTTTRVSLRADGTQITGAGGGQGDMQVDISADGRFVSFVMNQDLIGDDPSGVSTLYLRSLQTGFLRRVAANPSSVIAYPALSSNGENMVYAYATFAPASNVVNYYDAEANVTSELYRLDTSSGTAWLGQGLSISGNGRYVTFAVRSPALFNGSTFPQILAIDRSNPDHITIASGDSNGFGDGGSSFPKVSDDGRVLFATVAPNLTGNVANSGRTVLVVRDLQSSALSVASRRPDGSSVYTASVYDEHALSSDGTTIALVADEFVMTGGSAGAQVYVAPRP